MEINQILQLIIGVSILFVWLVRSNVPTNFRVGNANTLQGELAEVGLPDWFYDIIKIVKPIFAFFLLIGLTLLICLCLFLYDKNYNLFYEHALNTNASLSVEIENNKLTLSFLYFILIIFLTLH